MLILHPYPTPGSPNKPSVLVSSPQFVLSDGFILQQIPTFLMHIEIFHQVSERLYQGFVLSSNILFICSSIFSFLIQQGKSLLALFCFITLLAKEQQDKRWLFPFPDPFFSSYLSYSEFKQPSGEENSTPTWLSQGKVAVGALNPDVSSVSGTSRTLEGASAVSASAALPSLLGTVQRQSKETTCLR